MKVSGENIKSVIAQIPEGSGLIVFDGTCVLCNYSVGYLLKIDKRRKLNFATFDSEILKNSDSVLFSSGYRKSIVFIDQSGIYTESDAVLNIAKLTGSFPVLSQIGLLIPRFLRNSIYRLVARYRYRWFGKTENCIVPGPADAGRFYR
jgi:predicted DCC family thiol-disulfide oxidoreductase YuxK